MIRSYDLGTRLSIKFVRLFNAFENAFESYFVINGRWSRDNKLVAVEYNNRVRWLGKVVPLP